MIPEIKDPKDWYIVDDILKKMMRQTPQFYYEYNKFSKNIEDKIREISILDIKIIKHKDKSLGDKRREKLKEINDMIRIFSKMYLVASLSKR
jgi:hypothetical protein